MSDEAEHGASINAKRIVAWGRDALDDLGHTSNSGFERIAHQVSLTPASRALNPGDSASLRHSAQQRCNSLH
ncbi:hypothetical protein ABFU26_16385 [Xanthomonas campestris pv. raphani]|uniref:hypothetical protein n=1 Tax=Xanthomonas campestris TaxID=339 RepID=UPI00388E6A1E